MHGSLPQASIARSSAFSSCRRCSSSSGDSAVGSFGLGRAGEEGEAMRWLLWFKGIVGNNRKVTIAIVMFIVLLVWALWRPLHAAELDLRLGSSFAGGGA